MNRIETTKGQVFYVGEWLVEPLLHQVSKGTTQERLPPKFIQVLLVLAEEAGDVVTRETLLNTVWGEVVVTEAVLTRAIFELRKVFGDSAQNPTVIETIPKTGYRLIAPVVWEQSAAVRDGQTTIDPDAIVVAPSGSFVQDSNTPNTSWMWIIGLAGLITLLFGWWLNGQGERGTATLAVKPIPFTSTPGLEFDPAWSPNGQYMAYAGWVVADSVAHIFIRPVNGNTSSQVTQDEAWHRSPVWSPDGRVLAYVACSDEDAALYTVALAGGPPQKLLTFQVANCRYKAKIDWSPDGAWIVYPHIAVADAPQALNLYNVANNTSQPLIAPSTEGYDDGDPVFSQDGQAVAFVRSDARMMGRGGIWVVDLSTREVRVVTQGNFYIDGLDWMPDEQGWLFSSRSTLWHIAQAGDTPTWRYHAGQLMHQLAVDPKGERVAYVRSSYDTNIWRFDFTAEDDRPLATPFIRSTKIDSKPSISPNGERIAFISDRRGACGLWLARSNGQDAVEVVKVAEDCMSVSTPQWAQDGRKVALVVYDEGQADVYIADTAIGTLRRLTNTPDREFAPRWSWDGQTVYFTSRRSGQWETWKQDVSADVAIQVTTNSSFVAQEGPDGYFYYTKAAQVGLWRRPIAGGEDELIVPGLQPDDALNWRVTEQGVYFLLRLQSTILGHYNYETGEANLVARTPTPLDLGYTTSIAPDGSWGIFAQVDEDEEDILLMDMPLN